jgi:hypothetical protein
MEVAETIKTLDEVVREVQALDERDDPDEIGEHADPIVSDVEDPQLATVVKMDDMRDIIVTHIKLNKSRKIMKRAVKTSQATVDEPQSRELLPEIVGFDLRDLIVECHRLQTPQIFGFYWS